MDIDAIPYWERISDFFTEYARPEKRYYNDDGSLSVNGINVCARGLLEQEVFSSFEDMKRQALKDYHVILPEWISDIYKYNKSRQP